MTACTLVTGTGAQLNLTQCDAEVGGQWFQGLKFLPEVLNDPTSCAAGVCFQKDETGYRPDIPLSTFYSSTTCLIFFQARVF